MRDNFSEYFAENRARFYQELTEFLSFKSISADANYHKDCLNCANWLENHFKLLGASDSKIIDTSGLPIVSANFNASSNSQNAKTLLFYGHYDVQPVDPLDLWSTEPFLPKIKDNKILARGAQDNKGQLFYFVKALESAIKLGILNFNVKVLIEGEEECGSGGLTKKIPEIAELIKSDLLLVCDTGTLDKNLGAITMGLRGIGHLEFKLTGPNKDLHSGVHGGLVQNPATEISRLISKLHDDSGKIAIDGFYNGIEELSKSDFEAAKNFPISDEIYRGMVGVLPLGGEIGFPPAVRRGLRPTVEINGLTSGYQGEGSKTIIPSFASAKVSCRFVKGQDPEKCMKLLEEFLIKNTPSGLNLEILYNEASGEGFSVSVDSAPVKLAASILKDITGTNPLYIWEGASIPIIPSLINYSGAIPLLVGFGLEEDNIHAPNESFSLDQWEKGYSFCIKLLMNNQEK
jgi:acetylornithine deacetylase/succinyl-diaminopimelate desuccinylase-like protein